MNGQGGRLDAKAPAFRPMRPPWTLSAQPSKREWTRPTARGYHGQVKTLSGLLVTAVAVAAAGMAGCGSVQQSADPQPSTSSTSGEHNNNLVIQAGTLEYPMQPPDFLQIHVAYRYCTAPAGAGAVPTPMPSGSDCYSISADQPWGGVTDCQSERITCTITVAAGRHRTSEVSQWFQLRTDAAGMCSTDCGSWPPSELNFAINGSLQIEADSYQLALGQGSTDGGTNNWWWAGNGWRACTMNFPGTSSGGENGLCSPDSKYLVNASNTATLEVYSGGQVVY